MTTNSSNQDHYCNGDNKFSSEHSPIIHSEVAESKVIKCEDTVTESKAPQSKCTEPKAAQYATVDFAAAEFNNTFFKDSNGAEYKDIRSNNAESRGFESNTADCLSIGSVPAESKLHAPWVATPWLQSSRKLIYVSVYCKRTLPLAKVHSVTMYVS